MYPPLAFEWLLASDIPFHQVSTNTQTKLTIVPKLRTLPPIRAIETGIIARLRAIDTLVVLAAIRARRRIVQVGRGVGAVIAILGQPRAERRRPPVVAIAAHAAPARCRRDEPRRAPGARVGRERVGA